MDVKSFKRQHSEIMQLATYILNNIEGHTIEQNIHEVVKSINTINGKLKIHLLNEDKYLYPQILKSSDVRLSTFSKKYYEEMKEITKVYESYKLKYNTASKIKKNIDKFNKETKQVFELLANRVNKEEKELYPQG
ncbi:hemerythrin domain-containing protein [Clostridium sp. LBM24168]